MPRSLLYLLVILILALGVWAWWGLDAEGVPQDVQTSGEVSDSGLALEPVPAKATAAEIAVGGGQDRAPVAGVTALRGVFRAPAGPWPGGGRVSIIPFTESDERGVMGLFSSISVAARTGSSRSRQSWLVGEALVEFDLGDDGAFEWADPTPGSYRLELRHPDLVAVEATQFSLQAGKDRDLGILPTRAGAGLLVLVSDPAGRPIEGAQVRLGRMMDMAQFMDPSALAKLTSTMRSMIPLTGATDDRGAHRFVGLDGSAWTLRVTARGFVQDNREVAAAVGRDNVARVELLPGAKLSVAVAGPDGEPFAGARIVIRFPGVDRPMPYSLGGGEAQRRDLSYRRNTEADGSCEVSGLPSGRAVVVSTTPGFLEVSREVDVVLGETAATSLQLERGAVVTGRVFGEGGVPIPEARVAHIPMIGQKIMGFDLKNVVGLDLLGMGAEATGIRCDADGFFVFGGWTPGEALNLIVVAPGYCATSRDAVAGQGSEIEVLLRPAARVVGRVVGPDGQPIDTFDVELTRRTLMMIERPVAEESFSGSADGGFEVTGLPRESLRLVVTAPGRAANTMSVDLSEAMVDVGAVRLDLPSAIEGMAIDANGQPVSGVAIREALGGPGDSMALAGVFGGALPVLTDADGRFRIDSLTGRAARLLADKKGFAPLRSRPIRLTRGETVKDIVLELSGGGVLQGRVEDSAGQPLAGWKVQATHVSGRSLDFRTTDANGEFLFAALAPGTHKIDGIPSDYIKEVSNVMADGGRNVGGVIGDFMKRIVTDRVLVREGEVAELTLVFDGEDLGVRPVVRVVGAVTVGSVGLPAGMLSFLPAGSDAPRHIADIKDGSFDVSGVLPGRYELRVQSDLFSGFVGQPIQVEIPDVRRHRVGIDLPGGRIAGRVVYHESGDPAGGVVLSLLSPNARSVGTERVDFGEGTVLTGADGAFVFEGLAEGSYEIFAKELKLSGGVLLSGRLSHVAVGPNEDLGEIVLHVGAGSAVQVSVRDSMGSRPNALVMLLDPEGRPLDLFHRVLTDRDGFANFQGVPPGRYRISVDAPAAAPTVTDIVNVTPGTAEVEVFLTRGAPVDLEISAESLPDLSGEVLRYAVFGPSGALFRSGRLVIPEDGFTDGVYLVPLGNYEAGKYTFRAEGPRIGPLDVEQEVGGSTGSSWKIRL